MTKSLTLHHGQSLRIMLGALTFSIADCIFFIFCLKYILNLAEKNMHLCPFKRSSVLLAYCFSIRVIASVNLVEVFKVIFDSSVVLLQLGEYYSL